jgi:microcystin-dependent protein
MSEPFLGELRLMSFNFAPQGWAPCNGQQLPINQNQALFALLGTMYGGNGQTTFALPDLRGRAPIHVGQWIQGMAVGAEFHTLTLQQLPAHTHTHAAHTGDAGQPVPATLAAVPNGYAAPADLTTLHPASITNVGGSQPHENRPPSMAAFWCIALTGIFPSREF